MQKPLRLAWLRLEYNDLSKVTCGRAGDPHGAHPEHKDYQEHVDYGEHIPCAQFIGCEAKENTSENAGHGY